MDTTVVSGIGNIYACDALNLAKIHPLRPASTLSLTEIGTLVDSAKKVIDKGIELGGTTFDGKYVDATGLAGEYQSVVRVYGREGEPCPNCGKKIHKIKVGGRGTYYCEQCQV
jgi:formamidopyrimidine-DNA glycosylase